MDFRRCRACGAKFRIYPQVTKQGYCSNDRCQRERRRHTQQTKRKNDPDYKDNQTRAQQAWCERNPNYWQEYRRTHPTYRERNREQQKKRNKKRTVAPVAKMDASPPKPQLLSGVYRLTPISPDGIAKMIEWIVEINFISDTYDSLSDCKERT